MDELAEATVVDRLAHIEIGLGSLEVVDVDRNRL
jgi:hypothetical protein